MDRAIELLHKQSLLYFGLLIATGLAMLFTLVPILSGLFISQILIRQRISTDGELLMLAISLPSGFFIALALLGFVARQRKLARLLLQRSDLLPRLAAGWLDSDPVLAQLPRTLQRLWDQRSELGHKLIRVAEFLESYALYPRGLHPLAWRIRLALALLVTLAFLVLWLNWPSGSQRGLRFVYYFAVLGAVNLFVFLLLGWTCARSYANCVELRMALAELAG